MAATPAIRDLERSGVRFEVHHYEVPDDEESSYGEAVAGRLGVPAEQVFKTLVALVDGDPVVAVVSVAGTLGLKALARACGGKRAVMADGADAERLTGYVVGGISPFGRRRRLRVLVDTAVLSHATVFVSGGRRGVQVELRPDDLVALTGAEVADIAE